MKTPLSLTVTLTALTVLTGSAPASASGWKWNLTPYAWATDVGIDVKVDDRAVIDQTISVSELLKSLDTIFLARLEGQKGAHGFFFDLFDVTLSDDAKTVPLPTGGGEVTLTPEMGMTILDVGGLYDPRGDERGLQFFYGARILNERAAIDAEVRRADGSTGARDLDLNDTFVDALVGVRYRRAIGRRFSLEMRADVSKGGTEYTWSAGPTLGYAFGKNDKYTAIAGYRHMVVDFGADENVNPRMTLSGVVAGLRIAF